MMELGIAEDKPRIDHTPTPWEWQGVVTEGEEAGCAFIIGGNLGGLVCGALPRPTELDSGDFSRVEANAAFIVKAVNCHDELVEAAREALSWITNIDNSAKVVGQLRKALEKAK